MVDNSECEHEWEFEEDILIDEQGAVDQSFWYCTICETQTTKNPYENH